MMKTELRTISSVSTLCTITYEPKASGAIFIICTREITYHEEEGPLEGRGTLEPGHDIV